jgi:deoxyribose-phosphate aldolase
MTVSSIARMIDHTLLRASATEKDIRALCEEALRYEFAAVTVNPVWVLLCARLLAGTAVRVNACVGFPLGANTARTKVEEAKEAVQNGAQEIDMVINVGALKSGYVDYVEREIAAVIKAVPKIPIKVILETGFLTDPEKLRVCAMCVKHGAAFVKTCTGFGPTGATVEDVRLLRQAVGNDLGVKAAGGIRSYRTFCEMVEAGANRVGTSAAVQIMEEARMQSESVSLPLGQ